MSKKTISRGLVLVICFLVGGFVAWELFSTAFAILEFIIGGVLFALMMSAILFGFRRTREGVETVTAAAKAAAHSAKYDPVQEQQRALGALEDLNERLRTTSGVAPAVLDATEGLIDQLSDLVPRLYTLYPNDETAWTIGSVATTHLPRILDGYLVVEPTQRAHIETDTLSAVAALAQEVSTIDTLLSQFDIEGAKAQSDAIKARFGRQDFINP